MIARLPALLLVLTSMLHAGQRLDVEVRPTFGSKPLAFDTLALETQAGQRVSLTRCDLILSKAELLAAGKTGPGYHHESRPPLIEAEGTHHLMTFAAMHDAHVYVVHLSCEEALREAIAAKLRGVNVWVETLIQYLLIDKTYAEREQNFEGAKYVMSPPCATKRTRKSSGMASPPA